MNSSDNNDNRASASKSKVKSLIKEKKQLEKKIYRLETFYKTILDGIKSGVWVSNEDDVIVYSNKSMERIAHVNREELIGKHIYTDFPEITIKEFIKYYSKAKKSLEPVFYDNIDVLTPGMKHSFQSGWLIPVKKKEKFSKMICTVDDITKIKNIKEKLKDRESRYTAIVSSNSIGVARVDMDGRPIEINQYLHDFFGYSSEELKDIPFKDFTHPDDLDIDLDLFHQLLRGEREFYHIEKKYIHKNGKIVWGDLTATLVCDENDNPKYVVSLVQDITENKNILLDLKKSKKKLKKLNEKLESRVRARTNELKKSEEKYKEAYQRVNFYKNLITHDMNNILQNFRSSVELNSLYLEEPSKIKKLKIINKILKEQVLRAVRLINNASKLSKLEKKGIQLEKINLCKNLKTSVNFIKKGYQSRDINFQINCEFEDIYIKANDLLQDLFENLILNAIKHNDSPQIKISINAFVKKENNKGKVQLEFIDNGIGISDEKKTKLFESSLGETFSQKGMGLGLSLVKIIVDNYGGSIRVENRIQGDYTQGTKVILTFSKAE